MAQGQTGADQRFAFTTTGLPGPFDLGNDENETFPNLTAGAAFTVTGNRHRRLDADRPDLLREGADSLAVNKGARSVSGSLDYGDDVVCQYINTKDPSPPALLTVVKQVEPTVDAPAFSYTFSSVPTDPAVVTPFTLDPNPKSRDRGAGLHAESAGGWRRRLHDHRACHQRLGQH